MLSADLDVVGDFFTQHEQGGVWLTGYQCAQLTRLMRDHAEAARRLEQGLEPSAGDGGTASTIRLAVDNTAAAGPSGGANDGGSAA